jgi:hypothetical protein
MVMDFDNQLLTKFATSRLMFFCPLALRLTSG